MGVVFLSPYPLAPPPPEYLECKLVVMPQRELGSGDSGCLRALADPE